MKPKGLRLLVVPLILLTLVVGSSSAASNVTFIEHNLSTGIALPLALFVADIDSDGDPDIIGSSRLETINYWWENDGNGNFTEHVLNNVKHGGNGIHAADVDSDGDIDILNAVSAISAGFGWLENDGNQNFTEHTIDATFHGATDVFGIDVDNDGDTDIVGTACEQHVIWYENDGNENFIRHIIDDNFACAHGVFATDFDGDNDVDILGASNADDDIAWWENDGNENFTKHTIDDNFDGALEVYVTDLDNDDDLDVLGSANGADEIAWWENDGNENFTKHTIDDNFDAADGVFATDVDGDGDIDVLGASPGFNANEISWWENNGSQNFVKHVITNNFDGASEVYAADMDGDGDVDVVGSASRAGSYSWWEQFRPQVDGGPDQTVNEGTAVSLTASGTGFSGNPLTYVWDLDNDGTFETPGQSVTIPPSALDGPDSYAVNVQATDPDGLSATDTVVLTVVNLAPTANFASNAAAINEGGSIDVTFSNQSDAGPADIPAGFTYSYDCMDDGTFEATDIAAKSYSCSYEDDGSYTIRGRIKDKDGGFTDYTIFLVVNNVAPTATFAPSAAVIDEGDLVEVTFSNQSDPSTADVAAGFLYSYDCTDDGNFEATGITAYSYNCSYDDDGSYTMRGRIQDKDGGFTDYTNIITVNNVPPTATFASSEAMIDEGESVEVTFSDQTDPSTADSSAGFTYAYDCEGDSIFEVTDVTQSAFSCSFPDNGNYSVRGRIQDKDGGYNEYTVTVTVNNIAPTVSPITASLEPVLINTDISASASFTDPGKLDTHTAVWSWGDGTTSSGTVTEVDGSGSVAGSHAYAAAGVYTIQLTVTDKEGDSGQSTYEFVVVYNPDGGFVTGGGWIWSESGWCQLDDICSTAEGKANFGFVSKYKKGASVPTGNTEFNFKAGELNFHSDTYDWLVITGSNYARYKGSGTINGDLAPNGELYKFQIWAGDETGSESEDTFRIKIWYEDNNTEFVVYDNGSEQTIGGGNIQVHEGK